MTALVWFRQDLRLTDNPALIAACAASRDVIPVYVHAPDEAEPWAPGAASKGWLHHSLAALDEALRARGSRLVIREGPSTSALLTLAAETGARSVYWNRCMEPAALARDRSVAAALDASGLHCSAYNAGLLHHPASFLKKNGTAYRVFTPFWNALAATLQLTPPLPAPEYFTAIPPRLTSLSLTNLALLPTSVWDADLHATWRPGESGALDALERFLTPHRLGHYPVARDLPAAEGTSRLSPHLHFGEIGPNQVAWAIKQLEADYPSCAAGAAALLRELGWREFAHHVLWHFPHTTDEPMDARFRRFPWRKQRASLLRAWQRGRTGIPIVDAGMRQLWHTGWMHNRVRMIAASFLTKHCRIPWQDGARWFWDTLVDADLANNSLGWQWTAGCGVDAAPFFRIFNPIRQSERFDRDGNYLRRWLPELAKLPVAHLHQPWTAPAAILAAAGVRLGKTYPKPMVSLDAERKAALEAFAALRAS